MQKPQTVKEIIEYIRSADEKQLALFDEMFSSDPRKTIHDALNRAHKRMEDVQTEKLRIAGMYEFDEAHGVADGLVLGIDEVGRGPLAGPLCVAGVVLNPSPHILYLNDSKKLSSSKREELSSEIIGSARAYVRVLVEADQIDEMGMSRALHFAFSEVIARIDEICGAGAVTRVLIDGVPQHLDKRECAVVKGDAQSACIAAASILAKVYRDKLMEDYDSTYPGYDFASNKGYGSAQHIAAIEARGLTPIHRVSFCHNFIQESLF